MRLTNLLDELPLFLGLCLITEEEDWGRLVSLQRYLNPCEDMDTVPLTFSPTAIFVDLSLLTSHTEENRTFWVATEKKEFSPSRRARGGVYLAADPYFLGTDYLKI